MAIHLIAEKLGKDPIDIATLNLHGPTAQTDPNPVPSYQACVEAGKKLMNWNWHRDRREKAPRRQIARRKLPLSNVSAAFLLGI